MTDGSGVNLLLGQKDFSFQRNIGADCGPFPTAVEWVRWPEHEGEL
jgi:hypothetical protein